MTGIIPQSTALAEATVDSLTEVMSRDPEGYSPQDRDRIIEALRAQRARIAAADAAGEKRPSGKAPKVQLGLAAGKSVDDLGL